MCKAANNCELTDRVNDLGNEMENVKSRLSKVETSMDSMRNETRDGFESSRQDMKQIAAASLRRSSTSRPSKSSATHLEQQSLMIQMAERKWL